MSKRRGTACAHNWGPWRYFTSPKGYRMKTRTCSKCDTTETIGA